MRTLHTTVPTHCRLWRCTCWRLWVVDAYCATACCIRNSNNHQRCENLAMYLYQVWGSKEHAALSTRFLLRIPYGLLCCCGVYAGLDLYTASKLPQATLKRTSLCCHKSVCACSGLDGRPLAEHPEDRLVVVELLQLGNLSFTIDQYDQRQTNVGFSTRTASRRNKVDVDVDQSS